MRLFTALMKQKIRLPEGFKGPRGHIFTGKYRIVKKVTNEAVEDLKEEIKIEEKNMLYLRHPYLTFEQSHGHAKELMKNKKWYLKKLVDREQKYISKGDKRLDDYMNFLKISEDWDRIPS